LVWLEPANSRCPVLVLRAGSLDSDRLTDLRRVGRPAFTQERLGVAHLESPVLDLARLFVLYIDVEETVGIRPLDLRTMIPAAFFAANDTLRTARRPPRLNKECRRRPAGDQRWSSGPSPSSFVSLGAVVQAE
jgi:hypothetical protein